jgi:hypothetical protein
MPEPMDVKCPSCDQRLAAADESGLVNVLQEHLHEEHALAVSRERVRENGTYKKTSRWTYRDPKDWIGVPVPDAGVPGEAVERARAAVQSNVRTSRAAGREWELSGGVARCASCGSTMRTRTRARDNGGEGESRSPTTSARGRTRGAGAMRRETTPPGSGYTRAVTSSANRKSRVLRTARTSFPSETSRLQRGSPSTARRTAGSRRPGATG